MQTISSRPATDNTAALAARLRLSVTRLARRLRQESADGLTPSQTAALATIGRLREVTPSELAAAERIQRPTATRVLGALGQAGLVTRIACPSDGRSARVALTPQGSETLERMRSRRDAYLAHRLAALDADELNVLAQAADLLERLVEDVPA